MLSLRVNTALYMINEYVHIVTVQALLSRQEI